MSTLKITVNHNRCVGSRLCAGFLPEVFSMNNEGQSEATVNDEADVIKVVQTAEQCPQCAIRVEDSTTGEVLFPPAELEM